MHLALLLITIAGAITAVGTLAEVIRRVWRRGRELACWVEVIHDLVDRELTRNGGGSVKDTTLETRGALRDIQEQMAAGDSATAQMLDTLNTYWQLEHDAIWDALVGLGVDRRRRPANRRYTA